MSNTATTTATYTVADVENVVRRVRADLVMIADSTGAWTRADATNYAQDIETLARAGYLRAVDVTLLSAGTEIRAIRFEVDTNAGSLTSSRPGGVLWPRVANASLRIVLSHTDTYTSAARESIKGKLTVSWVPSAADTSHSSLFGAGGRNYSSNDFGVQRKDWTA